MGIDIKDIQITVPTYFTLPTTSDKSKMEVGVKNGESRW